MGKYLIASSIWYIIFVAPFGGYFNHLTLFILKEIEHTVNNYVTL